MDSFHLEAHPKLPTLELHGYLRSLVCIHCGTYQSRSEFQRSLAKLNPDWEDFLARMLEVGALDTENPDERRKKGLKTNPDGDVDLPDAPYTTFKYPGCPECFGHSPNLPELSSVANHDSSTGSTLGVLKPAVVMFGESIAEKIKMAAEEAVDSANKLLVVGSSLATYSAWRLIKRAKEKGLPISILNLGGVRGEDGFFTGLGVDGDGVDGVRCSGSAEAILPEVVKITKNKILVSHELDLLSKS